MDRWGFALFLFGGCVVTLIVVAVVMYAFVVGQR